MKTRITFLSIYFQTKQIDVSNQAKEPANTYTCSSQFWQHHYAVSADLKEISYRWESCQIVDLLLFSEATEPSAAVFEHQCTRYIAGARDSPKICCKVMRNEHCEDLRWVTRQGSLMQRQHYFKSALWTFSRVLFEEADSLRIRM